MATSASATNDDFEALFDDAPCGFLRVSPDWRIERVNATFSEWTGHDAHGLEGRRFVDLLDIAGKIYVGTHFAPLLRLQGKFDEVALNVVRTDGTKLAVLVNARERHDLEGNLREVLVSVFNATDRRRYESELLDARNALSEANETLERRVEEAVAERMRAEEALAHAQRMEAIGNLSAGIAHDFNNLLQVIGGNLQLLRKHVSGERGLTRIANAIGGVERGARLAGQLLAFGRRQTLDARVHDLGSAIETLAGTLVGTIGSEVELRVEVGDRTRNASGGSQASGGALNARVDLALLENAVINLAVNARDAMRADDGIAAGTITLSVARRALDAPLRGTAAGSVEAGDYVIVAVGDTGSGMPPEVARKVFDPFFTTKAPGEGTGLGLSMVYGFATQSEGHVTIDSDLGAGTTVRLWLPHAAKAEAWVDADRAASVVRGHETVLIVEDDEAVLDVARELLTDLGYEVLTARDGTSALSVLEANKTIHLVLTDIVMPGPVRGAALATLIEQRHPNTALVFTTGYADAAARIEMGAAAHAILRKPFTSEALARAVRTALDGGNGTDAVDPANVGQARDADRGTGPVEREGPVTAGCEGANAHPRLEHAAQPGDMRPSNSSNGPRVLLVEDEPFIRMDAAELLSDLGCSVRDVGTIADALEALEEGSFETLVTDIDLEDGSGIELAGQVRERYPDLRIVFATGHGTVDGAEALNASVLAKPYDQRSVSEALGLRR